MKYSFFRIMILITSAVLVGVMSASCNKDDVITGSMADAPVIVLDNEDGVYLAKVDREFTIAPVYINSAGGKFQWRVDGVVCAHTPEFTATWSQAGEYYLEVTLTTAAGSVTEEMRVDVVELCPPVISLPIAEGGITIKVGNAYLISPEISNTQEEDYEAIWTINGTEVNADSTGYMFEAEHIGDFDVTIEAKNIDGCDVKSFTIHVVDQLPVTIDFPTASYFTSSTTRYTFPGRGVYLRPSVSGAQSAEWQWMVDGRSVECSGQEFMFTPQKSGDYEIGLAVDGCLATVKVVCVNATEMSRYRAASASSRATSTKVFEWVPAPGQFIGETKTGGMTGDETTLERANAWAERRLNEEKFVSLGAWGGYIIVGFDHSIPKNDGQYDFSIRGNAFLNAATGEGGSNEPGIVYVMQDVNGNGLPDDEWYELRGSASASSTTLTDYAVTYYRPSGAAMSVQWIDNRGTQGSVDYLPAFHTQPNYYPAWITADSYTLRGTRLEAKTTQDAATGQWDNWAFDWGYADNMGSDLLSTVTTDGSGQRNGFLIENAMYPDGTAINLQYIDFIKVQTGVNSKAGWLGENSTEIIRFRDLSVK